MTNFRWYAGAVALLAFFADPALAEKFTTPHASGMCLGRAGNNTAILQRCSAAPELQFSGYGEVKMSGLCLGATGAGQRLNFATCNNTPAQRWGTNNGQLNNEQGYCADIEREARNEGAPIIAYAPCRPGASHQTWARTAAPATPPGLQSGAGVPRSKSLEEARTELRLRGYSLRLGDAVQLVAQGGGNYTMSQLLGLIAQGGGNIVGDAGASYRVMANGTLVNSAGATFVINGNSLVAQGGGNLVSQGGGNLVIDLRQARYNPVGANAFDIYSADGKVMLGRLENGNFLVAQGGGNLVSQGGGNLVSQGGGNVILRNGVEVPLVSQGGGNLVSQGGGNFAPGTPLAAIVTAGMGMNPPVSPLTGRALQDAGDFNTLKTRSLPAPPQQPATVAQPYTPPAAVQRPSSPPSRPVAGSQGTLVNAQNGRCMDVPRGDFSNGTQLLAWDCNGGAGQRFSLDNGFLRAGGKCVAAYDNGARGARVGLWDCVEHPSQKWTVQSDGQIRGPNNYCIGITDGSANNGATLILWDCVNAPNQQWRLGMRAPGRGRSA